MTGIILNCTIQWILTNVYTSMWHKRQSTAPPPDSRKFSHASFQTISKYTSWHYSNVFNTRLVLPLLEHHVNGNMQLVTFASVLFFPQRNDFEVFPSYCMHFTPFQSWIIFHCGLPWWLSSKEPACHCRRHGFNPRVGKVPWRRKWQPTPALLPGKSLAGYRLPGVAKSWTQLSDFTFTLLSFSFIC